MPSTIISGKRRISLIILKASPYTVPPRPIPVSISICTGIFTPFFFELSLSLRAKATSETEGVRLYFTISSISETGEGLSIRMGASIPLILS